VTVKLLLDQAMGVSLILAIIQAHTRRNKRIPRKSCKLKDKHSAPLAGYETPRSDCQVIVGPSHGCFLSVKVIAWSRPNVGPWQGVSGSSSADRVG
jgi:hypothetical protein